MLDAQTADGFALDESGYDEPRRPRLQSVTTAAVAEEVYVPSQYSSGSRKSWLPFVVAAHVILLWAAVHFDVTHRHHARQRLEVKLVPLEVAPPPKAPPPPNKPVAVKVQTPIVSPPPIVQMSVAAPPPVQSAPVPTPPAPAAVSAPTAPVVAAPVVPPDGFAATLGNVAPSYPMESRRNHEEGTVRLRVLISAQGTVQEIAIAKSSGYDALDDAALKAVRKWKFRPGTQAGSPVEAVGFLSIPFRLTRS